MLKAIMCLVMMVLLTGCVDPNDQYATFKQLAVPEGCEIHLLGYVALARTLYRNVPVIAVICEGNNTVTTTSVVRRGKTTFPVVTTVVN